MICYFVPEIFKFSYYENLVTDDITGCASTVMRYKLKNTSANNESMGLKLGRDIAVYEIYLIVHISVLLWQHVRFHSHSSSESNITICSLTQGKTYSQKCFRGDPVDGGSRIPLR